MFRSIVRSMAIAGIALAAIGAFTAGANAQLANKKTIITTNQPIQIPGVTLPAGKYVMKLLDVAGSRTVVRFMNGDENKVYATLLGIPDYKLTTPENSDFSFYEAKPGAPRALRSWFYPGDNYGLEFVYPKAKAVEIAEATGEHVIATAEAPTEAEPSEQALIEEPIFAVEPNGKQVEIAAVHAETPLVPAPVPTEAPLPVLELPKTATPLPLVGLIGLLAGGLGTGLRLLRRRN